MNSSRSKARTCAAPLLMLFVAVSINSQSAWAEAEHPFITWTKKETVQIRARIEKEPWAKEAYQSLPQPGKRGSEGMPDLLRYSIMADKGVGEREKATLLKNPGSNSYLTALRYDILYDLLTSQERTKVEESFRDSIKRGIESMATKRHNRWNWLPNLGYPWYLGLHLKAAVLRDEELMREIFNSHEGLKWYLDEYLSDLGFYNEEFSKMYNTPDAILLWGRACKRLGLDDIGFGYEGRQGATIRGHIESVMRLGMPRVDLGTSRPYYPRLAMGDAKGNRGVPAYGFQHSIVEGYLLDGTVAARASTSRLGLGGTRCWFELAHVQWPDAGFAYFLAQMRRPENDHYYPSLYFGLDPIAADGAQPPAAPSGMYNGRGLAVLRADESPNYWESPSPAVGMRLATPYAHHIQDCFTLTGFYAFNRPIYVNRQHSTNYSGVDPGYSNSARSHSTVIVDFAEPRTIGEIPTRYNFTPLVKFAAGRAKGVFDDVDQTRALFLTKEYLLDAFKLKSPRPRQYHWFVQALGHACPNEPRDWTESRDLIGYFFDLANEQSIQTDEAWAVSAVQSSGGAHSEFSGLGESWFDRRIGVRMTMLGEPGTTAYTAWSPVLADSSGHWRGRDRFAYGEDEPAGTAIVASRRCSETTFLALHEPFERHPKIKLLQRIAQDESGFVVRITGEGFTDYIMMRFGDNAGEIVTMGNEETHFKFADHAYVRQANEQIEAVGKLDGFVLPQDSKISKLTINGLPGAFYVKDGFIIRGKTERPTKPRESELKAVRVATVGPVAARWLPESAVCLPVGGEKKRTLILRNAGLLKFGGVNVILKGSPGLTFEPKSVALHDCIPGAEKRVDVTISAAPETANRLLNARLDVDTEYVAFQPARLEVAHGMVSKRSQFWPADFAETIYSPRYTAKIYYMDAGATSLLLDPQGFRRSGGAGTSYPNLVKLGIDNKGKEAWIAEKVPKFPYFITVVVPGKDDQPAHLYEAGRHAHGTTSSMEHWFTEDWIVIRYRSGKPDERIAFDWLPSSRRNNLDRIILGRKAEIAQRKKPGLLIVADEKGKAFEFDQPEDWPRRTNLPKDVGQIAAVFHRPAGYDYGSVMLYPPGAKRESRYVTQPADKPMGFTFCTQDEFTGLVKKWQKAAPTGQATDIESSTYNAAFMPHLERAVYSD